MMLYVLVAYVCMYNNMVYIYSDKPIIAVQQNAIYLAGICTALTREENTHTINSNLRKTS